MVLWCTWVPTLAPQIISLQHTPCFQESWRNSISRHLEAVRSCHHAPDSGGHEAGESSRSLRRTGPTEGIKGMSARPSSSLLLNFYSEQHPACYLPFYRSTQPTPSPTCCSQRLRLPAAPVQDLQSATSISCCIDYSP